MTPRWLLVVRRDLAARRAALGEAFGGAGLMATLLDRREGERRVQDVAVDAERRRRQRRRALAAKEQALWDEAGVRIVELPAGRRRARQLVLDGVGDDRAGEDGRPEEAPNGDPTAARASQGVRSLPETPEMDELAAAAVPAGGGAGPGPRELAEALGALATARGAQVPGGPRLVALGAWLDVCREALRAERLDAFRFYLRLAVRLLEPERPGARATTPGVEAPPEPGVAPFPPGRTLNARFADSLMTRRHR